MAETILCATRGGEASLKTQQHAIRLARERGARLVFFFVYDTRFLDTYTAPHVPAIDGELQKMGEFLLLMAKERAEKESVEAGIVVKEGKFSEKLIEAVRETGAATVIVGHPAEKSVTTLEFLQNKLAVAVREATDAEVIIL